MANTLAPNSEGRRYDFMSVGTDKSYNTLTYIILYYNTTVVARTPERANHIGTTHFVCMPLNLII